MHGCTAHAFGLFNASSHPEALFFNSLKTAFNWMFYAFSGYLESEQVEYNVI